MKITKVRGEDAEWLNSILRGKNVEFLVGHDRDGAEVYEDDIVTDDDGTRYMVHLRPHLEHITFDRDLKCYTLEE